MRKDVADDTLNAENTASGNSIGRDEDNQDEMDGRDEDGEGADSSYMVIHPHPPVLCACMN